MNFPSGVPASPARRLWPRRCWKAAGENDRPERDQIAAALGKIAKGIEHYGSTAVVGMRPKPIIDILVGIRPFSDWRLCVDPLVKLGYDYAENSGVPGAHPSLSAVHHIMLVRHEPNQEDRGNDKFFLDGYPS
ncbi:GrpB family protein [Chelativorans salis]|uniref:GrpB family protein n=1 Tax=Chelativorans salis TaxID=2978478 RepID=UPI003CC5D562